MIVPARSLGMRLLRRGDRVVRRPQMPKIMVALGVSSQVAPETTAKRVSWV